MCQFGKETKILKELDLDENEALVGWRNNYIINPFNGKEKHLRSVNIYYLWPKLKSASGNPSRGNSEGIYNNNNYNNNNNNYNNNYYNYNYYNYNYYNNNYYNYYCIQIRTALWGKVFVYEEGYRSSRCKPTHLVILDKDSKWFTDNETKKFAEHFNSTVEALAKEYNCETIEWSKRDK